MVGKGFQVIPKNHRTGKVLSNQLAQHEPEQQW